MSKLIVEMEMLNRCYDCDLEYGASCMAMGGIYGRAIPQMTWIKTRPLWCPIIGVLPEQHGDLVDRGKLLKDIEMYHVSDGCFQHWCEVQKAVVAAEKKGE